VIAMVRQLLTNAMHADGADAVAGYAEVKADLGIGDVVGVDPSAAKPYRTRCEIRVTQGESESWLPAGYHWNGADIPKLFWAILGVCQYDPRVLIASGFHDRGTESVVTPQTKADSDFITLLRPIVFNGKVVQGVGEWRAIAMYAAVRAYSMFIRGRKRRKES
jgi:hypothetical protein